MSCSSSDLSTLKKEIKSILLSYKDGCSLAEFCKVYKHLIGPRLPNKEFGYKTGIQFLYSMPDVVTIRSTRTDEYKLFAVEEDNVDKKRIKKSTSCPSKTKFEIPPRYKNKKCGVSYVNYQEKGIPQSDVQRCPEMSPVFPPENDDAKNDLPDTLKIKLGKVAKKYPYGMLSSSFSSCYEETIGVPLDILSLGYTSLRDLIEDFSDIFIKEDLAGIRKEFVVFPVKNSGSELSGIKSVCNTQKSSKPSYTEELETSDSGNVPFDAASPEFRFKVQDLPDDYAKYFPVYVMDAYNPGNLFIRMYGRKTSDVLDNLLEEMDAFYKGDQSSCYRMNDKDIRIGTTCVAVRPIYQSYHRAEIISISSMETVEVYFVDDGGKCTITKDLLRYIKKKFTELPAQAIRCRLAFIKPSKQETRWRAMPLIRMMKLCENKILMAKVEDIRPDGTFSITLCDTNGNEDKFINDILCRDGFAEFCLENTSEEEPYIAYPPYCSAPEPPQQEEIQSGGTDEDRFHKMCLSDHFAMKESILRERWQTLSNLRS